LILQEQSLFEAWGLAVLRDADLQPVKADAWRYLENLRDESRMKEYMRPPVEPFVI
jgi:hypothetical protein